MNDLHKALGDIDSIRRQVADSTEFRGYGPATLTGTGVLALIASWIQAVWLPDAAHHVGAYLAIWMATAALSAGMIGAEMFARTRRIHAGMADEMIRMAVEQFLPAVGVGGLMTFALVSFVPGSLWMLPGLWQLIFSLGVFSSCRFMPRPMMVAGVWYLVTGLTLLSLAGSRAFSPWAMGLPYALGQAMVAGILWWSFRESKYGV